MSTPSVVVNGLKPIRFPRLQSPIPNYTSSAATQIESTQSAKLQCVLADLEVATLFILENLRKRLIVVLRKHLDAFEPSPLDLGRTSVVFHKIKTGKAQLFSTNSDRFCSRGLSTWSKKLRSSCQSALSGPLNQVPVPLPQEWSSHRRKTEL